MRKSLCTRITLIPLVGVAVLLTLLVTEALAETGPSETFQPYTGLWWNPDRPGHNIDIQAYSNTLTAYWSTFESDGTPVWYRATNTLEGVRWTASLDEYTWSWETRTATPTSAGEITLEFTDRQHATLYWTLGAASGSEEIVPSLGSTEPPLNDYTGLWHVPNEPDYGLTISNQGDTETAILYFYDADGNPRWAMGSNAQEIDATAWKAYLGATNSYALDSYQGFCPGCPKGQPIPTSVGEITRQFTTQTTGLLKTDIRLAGTLKGSWGLSRVEIKLLSDPRPSGIGVLVLDSNASTGSIKGTFRLRNGTNVVHFSASSDSKDSARARYQIEGKTEELTVQLSAAHQAEISWKEVTMDGYGPLSSTEETALNDLRGTELMTHLALVPLELGCHSVDMDRAALAALLMPLQMVLKYLSDDVAREMQRFAALSSCAYFTNSIAGVDRSPPTHIMLSREEPVPIVFGFFPFDAEGTLESQPLHTLPTTRATPTEQTATIPEPELSEPRGFRLVRPCNAFCLGACGPDCPTPRNCILSKKWMCITDEKGLNAGKSQRFKTYACGVHQGCIDHDLCFDECNELYGCGRFSRSMTCKHGPAELVLRPLSCNSAAVLTWGLVNTSSWARGGGPYEPVHEKYTYKDGDPFPDEASCPRSDLTVSLYDEWGGPISPETFWRGIAILKGRLNNIPPDTFSEGPLLGELFLDGQFDRQFDITSERFEITLDAGPLVSGQHEIYVTISIRGREFRSNIVRLKVGRLPVFNVGRGGLDAVKSTYRRVVGGVEIERFTRDWAFRPSVCESIQIGKMTGREFNYECRRDGWLEQKLRITVHQDHQHADIWFYERNTGGGGEEELQLRAVSIPKDSEFGGNNPEWVFTAWGEEACHKVKVLERKRILQSTGDIVFEYLPGTLECREYSHISATLQTVD